MKTLPHLNFENDIWKENALAAGIDEVGRGSFAGPLVAAGVILKPITDSSTLKFLFSFGINDSKLISKGKRKMINKSIHEFILFFTVQHISADIINEKGIGFANKLAFQRVADNLISNVQRLKTKDLIFLTDAFKIPEVITTSQKNIIHGDATSISIALASILAKVERDAYMENLSLEFPDYGFEKHKGYGTPYHRKKLKEYGACPHHRTEFVKNYI